MESLKILGRTSPLFCDDIHKHNNELTELLSGCKVLVIGGAGSIGGAVTIELFKRNPRALHVVDISENNMVELVRSIRSTIGYGAGEFLTFAIDCGSKEFEFFLEHHGPYDYVFNLSALKHVRSEKDPFTLMRMVQTNIFNTVNIARMIKKRKTKKYFCVSTDKAANPVNMMGASKRIMELFLMRESASIDISMSRFANVAFSDGSLLHGFNQRFFKRQPITAPFDIRRYFITSEESGQLCMLSGLLGDNREIFFPKLNAGLHLEYFSKIAERFLESHGFEAYICQSEDEARHKIHSLIPLKKWPVYFFSSDTTGEKEFEEFYTSTELIDLDRFTDIGVISNTLFFDEKKLIGFEKSIATMVARGHWKKSEILDLFCYLIPEFMHKETGKFLDDRM